MKRVNVLIIGIALCASTVFAQGGTIALFGDPGGTECGISNTQPNTIVEVFVLHLFTPFASASAFSVPIPACATGITWLADTGPFFSTIGFSYSGILVNYLDCYSSPIHALTIQYWAHGASQNCCEINVEPYPFQDPPAIYVRTCDDPAEFIPANGGSAIINPNETCPCFNVPVKETTWSRVKALYVD